MAKYKHKLFDDSGSGFSSVVENNFGFGDTISGSETIGGESLDDIVKIVSTGPDGIPVTYERAGDDFYKVVDIVKTSTAKATTKPPRVLRVTEESDTTTKTEKGDEKPMLKGLTEIFGRGFDFGIVKDTVAKIAMNGKIAIIGADGRYKYYDETKKIVTDTTELSFDAKGLIMKLPVQKPAVSDVIVKDGEYYFVKDVNDDNEIKVVSLGTSKIETFAPETNLLGIHFYTKVVSIFSGLTGADATNNPMQALMLTKVLGKKDGIESNDSLMTILAMQSLSGNGAGLGNIFANPLTLMLLSGDKKSSKFGDMLPLMLLGQVGKTANGTIDPMMMMLLAGDGNMDELMPLMMMGGFGGTAGANPFANIFGAATTFTAAPTTPAPTESAE